MDNGLGEGSALPCWCPCSVAFSHSANRLAEMQYLQLFLA